MKVGRQNICIRQTKIVDNAARRHSAVADIAMKKGADEEFVNGQEEILAKVFFCTVVLFKEFGSSGLGIPEGIDLRCGGSDRNI